MTNEEKLRLQAIDLYNQGEKVSEIARRIARSRQWVYTWINRYKEGNGHWNKSQSKAPHHPANKISQMMEDLVVETRIRLESSPYMESGAYAIWHDMADHGIRPPSVATINRILNAHGLTRKKIPYQKSGIEYPETPLSTHIMDLIGPRYIHGGSRFYLLTIISNDTRHAGVYPIQSKCAVDITRGVTSFWKSYTMPDFLQLDNELVFKGSNRHPRGLGLLMRTAMQLNVIPRFIPVGEPWRNGVVERFNQKVERTLLLQQHRDFDDLVCHARNFMDIHNSAHHYSQFGHKTPDQLDEEFNLPIVPLNSDYEVSERPALDSDNLNVIHFVRLVRSDLTINVLNTEIRVDPVLMYTYVEAQLLVNDHILLIKRDGKIIQTVEFIMPVV